jgi:hypothetical protein
VHCQCHISHGRLLPMAQQSGLGCGKLEGVAEFM